MAKRKGKGHKALQRAVKGALSTKRDKLRLVPALMGAYVNGQKTLTVAGRPDFVWVRLRGATSEVAQAFNDIVGEHWDLPILIKRDEMAHDRWRVHGRDIRAYSDWGGASYLPPHAESHSFGDPDQTGGIDPVWVFKRQYMPLMPRPQVSGSMSIYLEPDFYYFQGEYHWWPGSGTADMAGLIPTGAFNAKYITVYIDGESGNPAFIAGNEFNFATYEPWGGVTEDPASYISLPNSSQGIPVAAVRLYTGSTTIGWGDIYDLRSPQQPLGSTGSYINIYDEGIYQGAVENIDFSGPGVEAVVSGTYAYIMHTGTAVEIPATGSVTVYDENLLLGQADAFNFAGDNVEAVMSGTTAHIMVTGSAGGGGHETGTMVIYDEGDWLGVFEEMRFIGSGVDAYNSGSYVAVKVPGYVGDGIGTGTWFRAGECDPLETITGGYWKIPEGEFATGSLCLAINGIWQTPVTDFAEQWPTSGTFAFVDAIPTGSVVSAQWGAPYAIEGVAGHLTGTMVIYEENAFLGVFEEMRFIGDGVTALNSGSYAAIAITGSAASIDIPATGSVTVFDESVLLGQADALNFTGDNVEAVMSGTTAHVMVTGTAGGGGGHETGTMVIYDESDWVGVFEEMRFIGDGVDAHNSGSYVAVSIPSGGASGGAAVTVTTGTFYVETLLEEVYLESTTGSVIMPGISQEYDHLRLICSLRGSESAETTNVNILFNGDTTEANYKTARHVGGTAHTSDVGDWPIMGACPADTATAGQFGSLESFISDYTNPTKKGSANTLAGQRSSAGTSYDHQHRTTWENDAPINRIDIDPRLTDGFVSGTWVQLFGVREEVVVTSVEGGGLSGGTPVSVTTGTFYVEEVLYDMTLGSATGSFIVPGISQEYDHLRIIANLRTDLSAVAEICYIYFNNDKTDANYRFAQHYAGSVHADGEGDEPYFMAVPSADAPADEWSSIQSIINDYADTSKRKSINVEAGERQSATIEYERNHLVWWENTNAVSQIEIAADAADFLAGSRLQVIGIKETALVTSVTGGGGHLTGTMVLYDEGDFLGVFEEMRFMGAGVDAYNSGSYAAIDIPGGGGGGGSGSFPTTLMESWLDTNVVNYFANTTWEDIRGCSGTVVFDRDCDVKIDLTMFWSPSNNNWTHHRWRLLYDGVSQGEYWKQINSSLGTNYYDTRHSHWVVAVTAGSHGFVIQTHDGGSGLDRYIRRTQLTFVAPQGRTAWV